MSTQPSSPLPASSASSTLVMTPPPIDIARANVPLAKGPLQPHISNLPRRKPQQPRNPNMHARRAKGISTMLATGCNLRMTTAGEHNASSSSSGSQSKKSQYATSPIVVPVVPRILQSPPNLSLEAAPSPIYTQQLGRQSGLLVVLDTGKDALPGVVRISGPSEDSSSTLTLELPRNTHDNGMTTLLPTHLDLLSSFVAGIKTTRIAVVAPPESSVDAFSIGLFLYLHIHPETETDTEMSSEADPAATRVHRLFWRWHDIPEEDPEGLQRGWRGLLSREGLDELVHLIERT
ncbi:hypothetical protein MIND_01186900 [Mycena indigotica]|uniref:Uncharacterized protein n=1 Tax=Mycena indigotica TaxID=2126181 RepID=A0A8H6S4R8_9AGAR|nr:uncharacterized protein MIND_01186900 [Mycena indigotica]KAF7292879.1 hypothetical protein MIND_01186900 [Mycena indigotica]